METSSDPNETFADIERELEVQYVPALHMMGLSPSEARRAFWHIMNEIREDSLKTETSTLPRDFGDWLLERENNDERVKAMLAKRRVEGVTDEDIRWWWNMHHLERAVMSRVDDLHRSLLLMQFTEEWISREEGVRKLTKYAPLFGEPDETLGDRSDDGPLPYELKERVRRYVQKRSIFDPEAFVKDMEESPSFNALVRKQVQRGNL